MPDQDKQQTAHSMTTVGFGTSALASLPGTYGHEVSEDQARRTINAILDSGVNLIDTSRNYGFGRAEERIGAVFAERGGKPAGLRLSTKVDRHDDTGRFDASQVRRSFEASLTALGVDRVDILHLHDPEHARDLAEVIRPGGAVDEVFAIKAEGLAGAVGVAMGNIDIQFDLVRRHPWDVVLNHNRFTLLNRQATELFRHARDSGMTVFNAAPYAGGMLAKGPTRFNKISYQTASTEGIGAVEQIERICHEHDVPLGAAALQFSLREPTIDTTIVGVSRPERVAETLAWATMTIPDALWDALGAVPYSTDDPEAGRIWSGG